MRTLTTTSMGTRAAWAALLVATACYGGGEPAGPLLTWTDHIQQGDGDQDDDDQGKNDENDEDEGSTDDDESSGDDSKDPSSPADLEVSDCLIEQVAAFGTRLKACRTCHHSKGLAKHTVFILSDSKSVDPSKDAAGLLLAFDELGQDLLRMPALEAKRNHPGGQLLKKGTATYDAWQEMIDLLADPDSCADK